MALTETELETLWTEVARAGPKPGQRVKHFKTGHYYTVVCVSLNEADMTPLVTYADHATGHTWTRTRENFMGSVYGQGGWEPRFELLEEQAG